MQKLSLLIIVGTFLPGMGSAQADRDFSGSWRLKSETGNLSVPADASFRVDQSSLSLTLVADSQGGGTTISVYPLDGRAEKGRSGDSVTNTETKWEGAALLISTIVTGPRNYTVSERWRRSADGNTLTIRRTVGQG